MILAVRGLRQDFPARSLFHDLQLTLSAGEFVTLIGPSGCGKSTLLRLVAGLLRPTRGELIYPEGARPVASMVFQEPRLLPWLRVQENIQLPLKIKGAAPVSHLDLLLKSLRLDLSVKDQYPHELSGGMKMRVAIARALMVAPDLLLMDEPFGALDEQIRARLQDELYALRMQNPQLTILFVSHSINEAVLMSDRVLLLNARGEIAEHWRRPAKLPPSPREARESEIGFNETRSLSQKFADVNRGDA